MKQKLWKGILCFALAIAMVISVLPASFAAEQTAAPFAPPEGKFVISQTDYSITNGVSETQVILNTSAGDSQVYGYMATIAPGASAKFKASYAGYYTANSTPESRAEKAKDLKWDLRTTTGQAADYEKATGETVILATNGDYYNMQTAQPCGYLIMEGNIIQSAGNTATEEPYFALLKNGTYVIRDYGTDCSDVEEAISGPFYLVKDGVAQIRSDPTLAPRNSIGIKADGTVITFLADGRAGKSVGMTTDDVARIMVANGAVTALYLDGGGSATYVSCHEGTGELSIKNTPSDGPERVVSSALLFVSTAEETGSFDHASLYPKNELYFAGTEVQFTASGVDAGGYAAPVPASAKWSLADNSFGTIDSNGLFVSNGKCGTVTVNLIYNNKTIGSTSITVEEPTDIYFEADSLNLAFHADSDLGLRVMNGVLRMNIGTKELDWTIEPITEGKTADDIGTITNNILHTSKAKETLQAKITVSYTKSDKTVLSDSIQVEIGRMPEVFWDFEGEETKEIAAYEWGESEEGWDPGKELTYYAWDDAREGGAGDNWKTESGPFWFDGNYLEDEYDVCRYPASNLFRAAGYPFYTDHTSYMLYGSAGGAIVSPEDGEVRFGERALRWDYDYSTLNPGYKNVNMWLYPSGSAYNNTSPEGIYLDGTPSGLGFWVYAPEGTANFWLWLQIGYYDEDGDLNRPYIHLTTQEGRTLQYTGIYWDGWMYVEADLTPYAKYVTPEHGLFIPTGQSFLSLTFIPGGSANENGDKIPMGSFSKGSLYFDNFRVVYGDNVDDMESPLITGTTANGTELSDETVTLNSNTVKLRADFTDAEGENATGINPEKTSVYVDGFKQELSAFDEEHAEASLTLPNGTHSIVVSVSDGFGNQTKKTYYVEVSDEESTLGAVSIDGADAAVIGETYEILLTTANSESVKSIDTVITLNDAFGAPTVSFENGYSGTYDYADGKLTIHASSETPAIGTAAKITFAVDPALSRSTVLNYSVKEGCFVDGETTLYFGSEPQTTVLTANYEISADIMVVNSTGKIYVTNADGSAPGKVNVYRVVEGSEPELLGTTNAAGVLITNKLCREAGDSFVIFALGENGYSFRLSGVTNAIGSDDVIPTNVRLNAVTSPAASQSITWFSAPEYTDKKAVVQYAQGGITKGADDDISVSVGTSEMIAFNGGVGDNNVSLVNTVLLENLEPGTTYRYRVGDGNEGHWSAWRQFTTAEDDAGTSFFVLGDTQLSGSETAESPEVIAMNKIADAVNLADVDLGIQTGDFVDSAASLSRWNQILGLFSEEYPTLPILQVLGNHEYYSDTSGSIANTIFDLPGKDWYSVEYGNVYIAVINCNANVEAAAKWLVEDAAKSDCTWKVLTLHQPPYYTNPKGSSAPYNKSIPAAAEAAGIDFVFSGHDHAYARTEPIFGGEVNEKNGVVYFICGDLGEKSRSSEYAPENNPAFHFAEISQDYDAIYLIVNTTKTTMTVTAYDLDGSVIDTYTKEIEDPNPPEPPVETHTYAYDRENDSLVCTEEGCGQVAPDDYTGPATDLASEKDMYFIGGEYVTGWFSLGDEIYHFDEETGEAHVVTILEDIPSTCLIQGYKKVSCACGETKTILGAAASGHVNEEAVAEDGTVTYVCKICGRVSKYNLSFADVKDDDWFAPNVAYAVENGLFSGRDALTFDPDTPMTRVEFVSVIWRLAGKPDFENTSKPDYTDCKGNSWYAAAVNWATKNGIVNGVEDGRFDPDGNISREQIVTILHRYAKFIELECESVSADYKTMFIDGNMVSEYADVPMSWAVGAGLIQGNEKNCIEPQGLATRAEVATMIMRYHMMLNSEE